jgi:hypothetical protein
MSTGDLAMLRVTAKRNFKVRRLAAAAMLAQGWTGAGTPVAALYYLAGAATTGAAIVAAIGGVLAGGAVRLGALLSKGCLSHRRGRTLDIFRRIRSYAAKLPTFLREEPPVQIDERFSYPAALRMPLLPGITTTLVPHYTDLLAALLHDRTLPPQLWRAPPMMVLVLHIWRTFTRYGTVQLMCILNLQPPPVVRRAYPCAASITAAPTTPLQRPPGNDSLVSRNPRLEPSIAPNAARHRRHVILLMFLQRLLYTVLFIMYALSLHRAGGSRGALGTGREATERGIGRAVKPLVVWELGCYLVRSAAPASPRPSMNAACHVAHRSFAAARQSCGATASRTGAPAMLRCTSMV